MATEPVTLSIRFLPEAISFGELDGGNGDAFVAELGDATIPNEALEDALETAGATVFRPVAPHFRHLPETTYDYLGNVVDLIDQTDDYHVTVISETDPEEIVEVLRAAPGIGWVAVVPPSSFYFTPDDDYYPDQWYLNNTSSTYSIDGTCGADTGCVADYDINAPAAWDVVDAPGTKIGLIDTGVRDSHEDLDGSIDLLLSDSGDPCGHGTALAGVMVGEGDNAIGIASVARPDGSAASDALVVLKAVDPGDCSPDETDQAAALSLLANSYDYYPDVLVVNESWGSEIRKWAYDVTQRDTHRNAYGKGLILVAASGNTLWCTGTSVDSCLAYPAAYNNFVIAATGYDCKGVAGFPDGSHIDIAAPSDMLITTDYSADDAYQGKNSISAHCGTSFSAPITAASAAMLLAAEPDLEADDVAAVLKRTATDRGAGGRDDDWGYGQLRLDEAIEFVTSPNVVHHDTETTLAGSYLESREQEFRRVPSVNGNNDNWGTFWVKVYQVDVTVSWTLPSGHSIVDAWPRKRLSTGFPDEEKVDARLLTGYAEIVPNTIDDYGCTLRTFTYKIYTDNSETTCLAWYPIAVSGAGACGIGFSQNPKFDYTYVSSAPVAPPPDATPRFSSLTSKSLGNGRVSILAVGKTDEIRTLEIIDVAGRLVARKRDIEAGAWPIVFDLSEGGVSPSGIYFARTLGDNGQLEATKIVVVR